MKNPIGLQTAYWSGTKPKQNIHQIIRLTKAAGMDIIELKAADFVSLSALERSDLRKEIKQAGLCITVNGTGLRPQRDISSSNIEVHKAGIRHLKYMIDLCKEMGAIYFSGIPYGLWNTKPEGKDVAEIKKIRTENAISGLKEVAEHAHKTGVILCMEIVNRFEQYIVNTVDEGIALCQAINNENCKLLLDTFHMNIEEDYIPDSIRKASEQGCLGYLHLGESNRRIPTGKKKSNIDWSAIAKVIHEIKFNGPMVMEPFVLSQSPLAESVSLWRTIKEAEDIKGLVTDAKDGADYLRNL